MTSITAKARATIKAAAADRDCKYRITADGEVHFYGTAPNSIVTCWWLFAQSVDEALDRINEVAA